MENNTKKIERKYISEVKKHTSGNDTTYKIFVDKNEWKKQQERVFNKFKSKISVPGFRKNKVPDQILKKHINTKDVLANALNNISQLIHFEFMNSNELNDNHEIIDTMLTSIEEVTPDSLVLKYEFQNYPKIEIPTIEKLKIKYEEPVITDAEVEFEVDRILKKDWMFSSSKEPIKNGDIAFIDFTGYVDGKEFDGGSATNYELTVGSNSFIPGFEEQLIGLKEGEEKEINVKFPEDYFEESLKNKPATFKIKIKEIKSIKKPEINDEYIKSLNLPNVKNKDDLNKYARKLILDRAELQLKDKTINDITEKFYEQSKFSYLPSRLLEKERNRLKYEYEKRAKSFNIDVKDIYSSQLGLKNEKEVEEFLDKSSKRNISIILIIQQLIEQNKIEITEKDLDSFYEKMSKLYSDTKEQIKEFFTKNNNLDMVETSIKHQKLFDHFLDVIKNKKSK